MLVRKDVSKKCPSYLSYCSYSSLILTFFHHVFLLPRRHLGFPPQKIEEDNISQRAASSRPLTGQNCNTPIQKLLQTPFSLARFLLQPATTVAVLIARSEISYPTAPHPVSNLSPISKFPQIRSIEQDFNLNKSPPMISIC